MKEVGLLLDGDKIGSAWVEIKVDDQKFRKGMSDAHGNLAAFSAVAPKVLKGVGTAFSGVTAAAANTAAAISTVAKRLPVIKRLETRDWGLETRGIRRLETGDWRQQRPLQEKGSLSKENLKSQVSGLISGIPLVPQWLKGVPVLGRIPASDRNSVRFNPFADGCFMEGALEADAVDRVRFPTGNPFDKAFQSITASASRDPLAYLSRIAESMQRIEGSLSVERTLWCPCLNSVRFNGDPYRQSVVIQPNIMISRDSDMRWLANELKRYL